MPSYFYGLLIFVLICVLGQVWTQNLNIETANIKEEILSLNNSLNNPTLSEIEEHFHQHNVSDSLTDFLREFHRNSPNMIKALESRARGDYSTYASEAAKVFKSFIEKYKNLPEQDRVFLFHAVPQIDEMMSDPNLLKFVETFDSSSALKSSMTLIISFTLMSCLNW